MKVYWKIGDIPELQGIPPAEQRELWRRAQGPTHRQWQVWLAMATLGALVVIGSFLGGMLGAGLFGAIGGLIYGQVASHWARPHLREMRAQTPTPPPAEET